MYSSENSSVSELLAQLEDIRSVMLQPTQTAQLLQDIHPNFGDSALNLLQYLSLRCHDLRPLQRELAALGLSSLGRAEACVLATVESVLSALHRLQGSPVPDDLRQPSYLDFSRGQNLLLENADRLFGPATDSRSARIMVTMPSEAATDYALVQSLLAQGMNGMRINCAHDDEVAWSGMIANLRQAETTLGKTCKVVMDLAGPKLRTGPIAPGPAVMKLKPKRDVFGCMTSPVRAWLVPADSCASSLIHGEPTLPVNPEWLDELTGESRVDFLDARGALRHWQVVEKRGNACCVELDKTAYLVPGLILHHQPPGDAVDTGDSAGENDSAGEGNVCELISVPPVEGKIRLHEGDTLLLLRDLQPGWPAQYDENGAMLEPAHIGCTIPSVFDDVKAGEAIWFDDGKIGGVIESVAVDQLHIRIIQAGPSGSTLRADKGINLPDSVLHLPALTQDDLAVLPFVAQHADMVELSFANTAQDVAFLQQQLLALADKSQQPAIVIKVETRSGFENLPEMLLMAMRAPSCGVMIARGDLAVECGFERLAEVQEEILWLCEAAHVPVIWATQVLESLAKTGLPSRAEITDAAMGHRAECVMLNKGPHIIKALSVLDNILRRMQSHHTKKRTMLRPLRVAGALMPAEG
jgi:pyruvate kinase